MVKFLFLAFFTMVSCAILPTSVTSQPEDPPKPRKRLVSNPGKNVIVRDTNDRCTIINTTAVSYIQGGIIRPIKNSFPCSQCYCNCMPHVCDGSRQITLIYKDGTQETIPERWPNGGEE